MDKAAGRTSQRDCCTGHHIHSWPANCCEKCGGPEAPLAFFSSPASMARWPSTSCTRARKRSRWLQGGKERVWKEPGVRLGGDVKYWLASHGHPGIHAGTITHSALHSLQASNKASQGHSINITPPAQHRHHRLFPIAVAACPATAARQSVAAACAVGAGCRGAGGAISCQQVFF